MSKKEIDYSKLTTDELIKENQKNVDKLIENAEDIKKQISLANGDDKKKLIERRDRFMKKLQDIVDNEFYMTCRNCKYKADMEEFHREDKLSTCPKCGSTCVGYFNVD